MEITEEYLAQHQRQFLEIAYRHLGAADFAQQLIDKMKEKDEAITEDDLGELLQNGEVYEHY